MAKRKSKAANEPTLFDVRTITAPCVPALRERVTTWRLDHYRGATETSRRLLNWWFHTDHRLPGGHRFAYHYSQQYAVETLVYLFEVARIRRQKTLLEAYATRPDLKLLQYDDFARYCVKMATGSGKTKVMTLAIAWQYFNAVAEGSDEYAKTFLLIAPNVIVFERLRTDFEGGRIFRLDPIIPDDLRIYWDFQCYMRGEGERAGSLGALYLSNVQQMYDRQEADPDEPDVMTAMLGSKPPANTQEVEDFAPRIAARGGPVVVLNDEAHHTHDEESEWNKVHPAAACEQRLAAWVPNSTSPPRRGTPKGNCSPGPFTIIH